MVQSVITAPDERNARVTNGREALAYVLAQACKLVLVFGLAYSGALSPLYLAAARSGLSPVLTLAFTLVYAAIVLGLFLVFRGGLGGTPAAVAPARPQAIATRGGEVGALAIAYALGALAQIGLNTFALNPIYIQLYQSGLRSLQFGLSLVVSVAVAAVVFAVFVALRGAFCPTWGGR
jgi:hypothetical protein